MTNRLVVSTQCPTCGAPLDFAEGSNAIQCVYCRSNLLVTGRKQVLSYSIAPKVDFRHAVNEVKAAQQARGWWPFRVVKAQLYFIPYYRLTGHDFRWESERGGGIFYRDRYVEKNFVARNLHGVGLYSLGIRPAVLRLDLFRRGALESMGKIVEADMSPEAALSEGMKTVRSQHLLYRKVIGQILSVIYFPFWVVEVERQGKTRLSIVDAVAQTVIKLDALSALYTTLDHEPAADPQIIGFRPLACPNCGWDLPVRPDDVIFVCSSCDKAWQIYGSDLYEVSCQIAEVRAEVLAEVPNLTEPGSVKYLPFWLLQIDNLPFRHFLPAFRYRRLKLLTNLAMIISRQQPSYAVLKGKRPEVHGCYYDQEDAVMLAQVTYAGLTWLSGETKVGFPEEIKLLQKDQFSVTSATLTWFPFQVKGHSLLDPFTGLYPLAKLAFVKTSWKGRSSCIRVIPPLQ